MTKRSSTTEKLARVRARFLYVYAQQQARKRGKPGVRVPASWICAKLECSELDWQRAATDMMRHFPSDVVVELKPGGMRLEWPGTDLSESVRVVFDFWVETMGRHPKRTKLTGDRRAKIQARLRDGYGVEQLKAAILGCAHSGWHMGENPKGKEYNDLTLIMRSGSKLEGFMREGLKSKQASAPRDSISFADWWSVNANRASVQEASAKLRSCHDGEWFVDVVAGHFGVHPSELGAS